MIPSPRGQATTLIAHAILIQVFTYAVRPALSYGVIEAGAPSALLGVLAAAFAVPALAMALPAGALVDRIGERPVAIAGALLVCASGAAALLGVGSVPLLLLSTLLLGAGHLLSVVSEQAVVANRSREGRRDSAFGLYTLAASIGQALGPLLLALPSTDRTPPLGLLFLVSSATAALLLVSSLLLRSTSSSRDCGGARPEDASAGALLRTPGVGRALLASSLALASVDITLAYWPALSPERQVAPAVVSAMLVARSLCTMLSRGTLAPSTRRFGRQRLIVGSLLLAASALVGLVAPLPPWLLIVLAGVYGLAIGVCQPITMSWITDLAPAGSRGMAMSLRLAGNRVGQAAVPVAVGAVAGTAGVGGVLLATGAALCISAWSATALKRT